MSSPPPIYSLVTTVANTHALTPHSLYEEVHWISPFLEYLQQNVLSCMYLSGGESSVM